jgi:hypothetical protein
MIFKLVLIPFGIIIDRYFLKTGTSMKKPGKIILLLGLLLFSCTKDEIKFDPNNLLIGVWNYSDYQDNVSIYARSRELSDNHSYKFNSDGTLIERKISGWCATPPVSYANYQGNWTILNDTLIQISVGYWGGTESYKLDIKSVTSDTLKAAAIYPNN